MKRNVGDRDFLGQIGGSDMMLSRQALDMFMFVVPAHRAIQGLRRTPRHHRPVLASELHHFGQRGVEAVHVLQPPHRRTQRAEIHGGRVRFLGPTIFSLTCDSKFTRRLTRHGPLMHFQRSWLWRA